MVAPSWLLWLTALWLTVAGAFFTPRTTVCDLEPCRCTRGQLICDCTGSTVQDIVLSDEQYQVYSFSSVSVSRCGHVHVESEAFTGLPALQHVTITDVAKLTLEERSFHWTADLAAPNHRGLLVNVTNTHVPVVPSYAFGGSLREVLFTSVNVSRVRTFGFGSINHADKIEFTKVTFGEIETQAFKRIAVQFLIFRETIVDSMPERTLMDIQVHQEVRIDTARIGRIKSNAFNVFEPRDFKIVQSTINNVESNAFHVHTKGDVSIRDNVFGNLEENAFLGFTVEKKYFQEAGKEDIVFENNTIVKFEENALTFNTTCLKPRLDRLMIRQQCTCQGVDSWITDLVKYSSDPKQKTPLRLDVAVYCLNPTPTSIKDYLQFNCFVKKSSLLVKVVVGVVAVLLVTAAVCGCVLVYCRFRKRGKRYINVAMSRSPPPRPAQSHRPHMLVVPEGKTYRETELHVIVDHAEPIVHIDYVKDRSDVNDNQ